MRGGSLKELQEILGHKDVKMTMRYALLIQEHKKSGQPFERSDRLKLLLKFYVSQNCHIF